MRKNVTLTAAALLTVLIVIGGCVEADDQRPSRIDDLHALSRADALVWNSQVKDNGDLTGDPNTRILAWTAPGDDGNEGTASLYDIRYFRQAELTAWGVADPVNAFTNRWDDAHELFGENYPSKGGSLEQVRLPRLRHGEDLYFAIKTEDEIGQLSKLSRVAGPFQVPMLPVPMRSAAGADTAGFATRIAGAGDFNNDNHPDLIVSSPIAGSASIVLGRSDGGLFHRPANTAGVKVLRTVDQLLPRLTIVGNPADEFGRAVAGINKINNDKNFDVAVGAPAANTDAGAVYIKLGGQDEPKVLSADSVDFILTGEVAGDRFGEALAPAFDLDRDGRAEFMVGAPGAFGTGAVYIFRGRGLASGSAASALVVIKGESAGDGFGAVTASVSDVNGDGVPDFAVGAPASSAGAGAVYIFYGGAYGVLGLTSATVGPLTVDLASQKADVTIRGTAAGRNFGSVIAAAGQVSGADTDYFDFAVSGGDTVYVYFGGVSSLVTFPLTGSSVEGQDNEASARLEGLPTENFGAAVAGIMDINADGDGDLLVGAPGVNAAYIFHGPLYDLRPPDETITAAGTTDFGAAAAGAGDMNGDGAADFAVGAPSDGRGYYWF